MIDKETAGIGIYYGEMGLPEEYAHYTFVVGVEAAKNFIENLPDNYEMWFEKPDRETYFEEYCDEYDRFLEENFTNSKESEEEIERE